MPAREHQATKRGTKPPLHSVVAGSAISARAALGWYHVGAVALGWGSPLGNLVAITFAQSLCVQGIVFGSCVSVSACLALKMVPVFVVVGEGVWGTQCPGHPQSFVPWRVCFHTTKAQSYACQPLPAQTLFPSLPVLSPMLRDWSLGLGGPGLASCGDELMRVVHLVTPRAKYPTGSPVCSAGAAGRDVLNYAICILISLILTLAS